jgi:small subunit ribosomal protein S6
MAGRARNLCAELAGQAHREEASLRDYERAPRKYELMTILHPEVAEEALPGELERISGYISTVGGELTETLQDSPWGRRRLAYPIRSGGRDVRDGYYTVWHFEVAPTQITELERELKLNEQVIRYIVVSWEPKPLGPKEIEAAEIAAEDAAAAEYAAAQDAAAAEYEASVAAAAAEAAPESADAEATTDSASESAPDTAEAATADTVEEDATASADTATAGESEADAAPAIADAAAPAEDEA